MERADLLAAYRKIFENVHGERWRESLATVEHRAGPASAVWPWSRPGDRELAAGGDAYRWLLRRSAEGRWLVVAERTDF